MATEVIFPKVDMDMEAGSIIEWLKSDGDMVSEGEPLFVIETDKASMEIEAAGSGHLAQLNTSLNTPIRVGTTVAWILESIDEQVPVTPTVATDDNVTNHIPKRQTETADNTTTNLNTQDSTILRASPSARRVARELAVDLTAVQGSALRGRIVANDVQTAAERRSGSLEVASIAQSTSAVNSTAHLRAVPHSNLRKNMAARLQSAAQLVPAFQLSVDINCKNLNNTRNQFIRIKQRNRDTINTSRTDSITPNPVPSINDFVIKAMALALQEVPVANCSWDDNAMQQHVNSDIAIAVSVADGVLAPVIRQAETQSLHDITVTARQLANRAREQKLAPMEYQGGATTVSNLGKFGVRSFSSIIVPPQASIVSIGSIRDTALVKEGRVRAGKVLTATFTFDHRVIDGVPGAQLADAFRYYLEHPVELLI